MDRHATGSISRSRAMQASLLALMEELLQAMEQRDAGDPDAPAWEACARIDRLEEEIAQRLAAAGTERGAPGPAGSSRRHVAAATVTA
jgi:hypothetical protein